MGWLNDDTGRDARARMAQAEKASERRFPTEEAAARRAEPRRYRLYDRIAKNVSVSAMNVVIAVVCVLLVLALIIGVATGNPR